MKGTGLSAKECEICDFFVYIPQYGCGTASLNVTVAASIVLHHFGEIIEDFSVMWGSRGVCAAFRESQHTHLSLVSFWVGSKWEPSHQRRSFQLRESRSQKENKKNEAVDRPSLS
ncbi:hypothetical protein BHE74_00029158 [Ensete ventricosum]|nr:hypothetical protein GW17_00013392 [Ensete ventricosum]RWW63648.1 hypothetical protein BHE74_00029158 [Ensete ventricosum]